MRSRPVVALTILLLASLQGAAHAQDVSGEEFSELSLEALTDPRALAELRSVDSVDGVPVDMEAALAGASGEELDLRLQTLAAGASGIPIDPGEARAQAQEILEQKRYQPSDIPQPFKGLFRRLGEWLRPIGEWISDVIDSLASVVPGGRAIVWALLSILILAGVVGLVLAIQQRRLPREARGAAPEKPAREDPRDLERAAETASAAGDYETAIRLRFRAGLLRLAAGRAIEWRPSLTSGQVSRALGSGAFDEVAGSFDEIVYGKRRPTPDDVERARTGWARVLAEVG